MPAKTKVKTPGTPKDSASLFTENTRRKGRNGFMYKVVFVPSTQKLVWKQCNGKSVLCKGPRLQGPQRK